MANLGNLFYEVQIKDSTSAGIKSIEDKIRKLNVAISPKIDVNGLNSALSAVSSKKGTELKLTVKADTKAIVADINSAISKNKFTAAVKANVSSLAADIQSAINKGSYVAKVAVDTSGIKKAVQSAVGETIKVKTTQDTGKKSQRSEPAAQPARQGARPSAKSSANAGYLSGGWKEKVVTKSGWIPDLKSLYRGFYSTQQEGRNLAAFSKEAKEIAEMQRYVNSMKGRKRANMQAMLDRRIAAINSMKDSLKSESGQQRYVEGIRQMLKNPYRVMTVRNLPEKGSARYNALEKERAVQRASRESDIKNAFKNADALAKARETLGKISAYTSKGGQLSPELKNAQSALNRYVQTLENAKRVENKDTRAPLLYNQINKAAASATTQLKALNAESAKQARVAAANRAALRVPLQKSSEPLSSAIGYIRNVNRSFPIGSAARDNAYNTLKPLIADVQRYRHEIRSNAINGTKADPATLSKLNSAVDALNAKMRQIDKVASNIKLSKLNAGGYARDLRNIVSEMQNVGSRGGWLRDQLQNIFSIYGAKQFLDNLIQIGGEFEKQKIALGTLFGSKLKADTMYSKIQNLAVQSPFTSYFLT